MSEILRFWLSVLIYLWLVLNTLLYFSNNFFLSVSIREVIGKSSIQSLRRAHKRKLKGDGSDDVTAAVAAALRGMSSGTDASGAAENRLDPQFLEADRQYLSQLRKDEIPAQTRSTVLCKSGAVC